MSDDTTPDVDALRETNGQRMQALAEAGVTIDPIIVLKARLDMVTDMLMAALGLDDDVLEKQWEGYLSVLLTVLETQGQQDAEQ